MKRMYLILPILIIISVFFITVVSPADAGKGNIAPKAILDAPECNPLVDAAAITDGTFPESSFGILADKYSSHAYVDGFADVNEYNGVCDNYETLTFTWETEVTIDSIAVFFACSAPERELWLRFGGEDVPAAYTIEYLKEGEYEPVLSPIGLSTERDKLNLTSFGKVTTTSIRIVMTKLTDDELRDHVYQKAFDSGGNLSEGLILSTLGIGIYEIEIYDAPEEATDTIEDATAPEETTAKTEVTTVPEETADEAEVTTVHEETTGKTEVTTVPEETTDETEVTTVHEETTGKTEVTTVPEETIDEAEVTTVPEETTGKTEVTTVHEETTGEPVITTIPEEITGEPEDITVSEDTIGEADGTTTLSVTTDTTDTTSAKAVTSAYMNEGSAFDSEAEVPSLPKMLTVSAVAVTAAISIICGAVLIIKKKH